GRGSFIRLFVARVSNPCPPARQLVTHGLKTRASGKQSRTSIQVRQVDVQSAGDLGELPPGLVGDRHALSLALLPAADFDFARQQNLIDSLHSLCALEMLSVS